MFTACVVILLLILINALYVAGEFAAVGVRKSRIRQMAEEGSHSAALFLPWLEDPHRLDRYIAACQIGITLSSLVLGAYGQRALTAPLVGVLIEWGGLQEVTAQSVSALVVLMVLTALQVVLGELVPKSIALQYSTQSALSTLFPMRWSVTVFSGLIAILNGSALKILKMLGVPYGGHRHIHSPEEIEMLLAESRDGGVLEADEHLRLQRALHLGKRPAHQLMVSRRYMSAIDVEAPLEEILRRIADSPYSHLPVYRGSVDNVIGIVHVKEVVIRYIEKGAIGSITEVMRPVMSVPENVTADSLLNLLRQRRSHQAMVVDEFGGTEGLVTLEDVLSEMLGEVADEFKRDHPQPERLPDGRVRLPGLMRLDVASPWLGVLWEGESDTISGLVTEVLGAVPAPGQKVTIEGVEVEIEKVAHHAVASILARPVQPPVEDVGG
jgi:putative hemolysin